MYGELQRDMGPYRTVSIALYMFTHVLQVNMYVFLACTDKTHTNFTLLHMSGIAVGQYIEYRADTSGAVLSLVTILATDS